MISTRPKVLIVDDEVKLLELIKSILEDLPIEVITAQTGEEGIRIIKDSEEFAVTVSNYYMGGGMNGGDFLKFVGSYSPKTVRILMTGGLGLDSLEQGQEKGDFESFSIKPIILQNFVDQVEKCVAEYHSR